MKFQENATKGKVTQQLKFKWKTVMNILRTKTKCRRTKVMTATEKPFPWILVFDGKAARPCKF